VSADASDRSFYLGPGDLRVWAFAASAGWFAVWFLETLFTVGAASSFRWLVVAVGWAVFAGLSWWMLLYADRYERIVLRRVTLETHLHEVYR